MRTRSGERDGGLSDMHAADLSAMLDALAERAGIDPGVVSTTWWLRLARWVAESSDRPLLRAGGRVAGGIRTTINRACGQPRRGLGGCRL